MSQAEPLIRVTESGLYCAAGGFHIDPWRPVPRAVLTHAHADHARPGSGSYLAAAPGEGLLRARLGGATVQPVAYGETLDLGAVRLSLHPAGHVLGSAQVRVERGGEVWVVSGDYKLASDPTCAPFEPVRCHVFISECTFGLPVYRWADAAQVAQEVADWWRENRDAGRASLLGVYALGKAQRLLALLGNAGIGPVWAHGAVERISAAYRGAGVALPQTSPAAAARSGDAAGALVLAPPSALAGPWARRFGDAATAFASGWMRIRGARRRRGLERGFVLSDHADWPGLLAAIEASGAQRVLLTHGFCDEMAAFLRGRGLDAGVLRTEYEGEAAAEDAAP